MAYISLTRLVLKSPFKFPRFAWYSYQSSKSALASEGLMKLNSKAHDYKTYATMSLWVDRKHMLSFVHGPAHKKAIKQFDQLATGRTYGYEADRLPDWGEAQRLLDEKGREV